MILNTVFSNSGGASGGGIFRQIALTQSQTFTVPQTGEYIVTCVGHGGNGGSSSGATPGGPGGSGAIARSILQLTKGDTVAVTVSNAISSFGSYLSASCGEDGTSTQSSGGTPGAGGIASGGNVFNVSGIQTASGSYNGAPAPIATANAINWHSINDRLCGGSGYNPFYSWESYGGEVQAGTYHDINVDTRSRGVHGGGDGAYGFGSADDGRFGGGGAAFGGGAGGTQFNMYNVVVAQGGAGGVVVEYFENNEVAQ